MARDEQTNSEENASAGSRRKEGSVKDLPEMALFRIQKQGGGDLIRKFHLPYPVDYISRSVIGTLPSVPRTKLDLRAANNERVSPSHHGICSHSNGTRIRKNYKIETSTNYIKNAKQKRSIACASAVPNWWISDKAKLAR